MLRLNCIKKHYQHFNLIVVLFKSRLSLIVRVNVVLNRTVNNNSPIQDYVHPDDQTQPTFEMTPGFKPFTVVLLFFSLYLKIADILGWHRSFWNWKHEIHGKIMIMLKK